MENYDKAAETRLKDFCILRKNFRKVGTIHLGGIYIECLLKSMICCKYQVTDASGRNKWLVNNNEVTRPSHRLTANEYKSLLQDVYDDMSSDVEEALGYVSDPDNVNYIDYRYKQEELVSDQAYQKFLENFQIVFRYFQEKKKEI